MVKRLLSLLILLLALSLSIFADTIRLKDGSIIKGKVIGFRNGQFIVLVGSGSRVRQVSFYADEVESIEFDSATVIVGQESFTSGVEPKVSQEKPTTLPTGDSTGKKTEANATLQTTVELRKNNPQGAGPVAKIEPVRLKVKVLADSTANGWTSTGWVVKKGQRIRIIGRGQVYLGSGKFSGPEGMKSLPDPEKLIPQAPTGALIAVIGDDNNDFIFIGAENEFVAEREGVLFLGVNEGNLDDNTGAFDVVVEIYP